MLISRALALAVIVSPCLLAADLLSQATPLPPPTRLPTPQSQPQFRSDVTLVPLDIRVVDKNGRPVTDLTAEDFTILENGKPQTLGHFATHAYTADASAAQLPGNRPRRASDAMELTGAENRRTFLLVLGRGRLTGPSHGMDAMLHLVNERLMPQDQVAVVAWNRATDFTTDHASIAIFLERFKKQHVGVELAIRQWETSLERVYGDGRLPTRVQKRVDAIFGGASAARSLDASVDATARIEEQARRISDGALAPSPANRLSPVDQTELNRSGGNLDDYLALSSQTVSDLHALYMGVEFLRHLAGEKHLVYLAEYGLSAPSMDDDRGIARRAADARVSLSFIHTGGLGSITTGQAARTITGMTGGQFFANRHKNASMDVDRIEEATRFVYALGYYPSPPIGDGRYRRVAVRVNRPGLTVLSRDGYFAKRDTGTFERKGMMIVTRVTSAAEFPRPIIDVALREVSAVRTGQDPGALLEVSVTIDLSRVAFDRVDGRNTAELEVAAFAVTGRQKTVGQSWQTLVLSYSDARLAQVRDEGLPHEVKFAVTGATGNVKDVKVVAYNYDADLVGSIIVKVK